MKTEINGIVLNGNFYEQTPDSELINITCGNCDLAKCHCCLADYCTEYGCHFRFSPELTELLAKPLCPEKDKSTAKKLNGE